MALKKITVFFLIAAIFNYGVGAGLGFTQLAHLLYDRQTLILQKNLSDNASFVYGALVGIFGLSQLIATPYIGYLADRFGTKRLLVLTLAGAGMSFAMTAYAIENNLLSLLFLSRALTGALYGNQTIALAILSSVPQEKSQRAYMALAGSATGLSMIVGPLFAFVTSSLAKPSGSSTIMPFIAISTICLLNAAAIFFTTATKHKATVADRHSSLQQLKRSLFHPRLRLFYLLFFLLQLAWISFYVFFGTFLLTYWRISISLLAPIISLFAGCYLLGNYLVVKIPGKPNAIIVYSSLLLAPAILAFSFAPSFALLLIALSLIGCLAAINYTSCLIYLSQRSPISMRGKAFGLSQSIKGVSSIIAPLLGGALLNENARAPFLLASVIFSTAIFFSLRNFLKFLPK